MQKTVYDTLLVCTNSPEVEKYLSNTQNVSLVSQGCIPVADTM